MAIVFLKDIAEIDWTTDDTSLVGFNKDASDTDETQGVRLINKSKVAVYDDDGNLNVPTSINIAGDEVATKGELQNYIPLTGSTQINGIFVPNSTTSGFGSTANPFNNIYNINSRTNTISPIRNDSGGNIGTQNARYNTIFSNNINANNFLPIAEFDGVIGSSEMIYGEAFIDTIQVNTLNPQSASSRIGRQNSPFYSGYFNSLYVNNTNAATYNEGVLYLESKYFTPVDNGSGGLMLQGITFDEIQTAYTKYNAGLRPVVTNTQGFINLNVISFIVDDDIISLQYNFALVDYDNSLVNVYRVLISATTANIITPVQLIHSYNLRSLESTNNSIIDSVTQLGDFVDLTIGDSGLIARLAWRDATVTNLIIRSESTSVVADIRRASIYGDASQGYAGDTLTIANNTTTIVDDIYQQSNDTVIVNIGVGNEWYQLHIFISGQGARTRMSYIKLI